MTTPTRSPSPRRAARKPTRPGGSFYRQSGESIAPALIITVLFHVLLFEGVKHSSLFLVSPASPAPAPMAVNLAPQNTVVPAHLLPPEMRPSPPRFVEINPLAPSQKPDHERTTGAADQRAAQPVPEAGARGETPKMDGENPDSTRVVNAIPRELLPRELQPRPGSELGADTQPAEESSPAKAREVPPPPKKSDGPAERGETRPAEKNEPKDRPQENDKDGGALPKPREEKRRAETPSDKKTPGEKQGENDARTPTETPAPKPGDVELATPADRPAPRARPRASIVGTTGPLARNLSSAGEAGVVAVDSTFSPMGEYAARMMEIIQAAWWVSIERSKVYSRGHVVIEFTLHKDGTVTDVKILEQSADLRAAYLCKDSIVGRAPFDPWPQDMIGVFGDSHTGRITFHYR